MHIPTPHPKPGPASSHQAAHAARQLRSRYILAMVVLALLTLAAQATIQFTLIDKVDVAYVIDAAGDQRMYCGRLNNAALALEKLARKGESANAAERARCALEMRRVSTLWKQSKLALLRLNKVHDMSGRISSTMLRMADRIEAPRRNILDAVGALVSLNARPGPLDARGVSARVRTIQEQLPLFMQEIDEYVYQYRQEVRASNEGLQHLGNGILIAMMLVIVLQGVFVFRPALARVRRSVADLLDAQALIEQQNAELRTNNALLEAQQAELEAQQDELAAQQDELEQQARELERHNVELRLLNDLLEQRATTDGLTGLKNHSAFRRELERMAALAVEDSQPLSVILLDVDHFKQYNDTYGHPAGDEVLRQVARLLQGGARAGDMAARYGGEEFILLLPHTDALEAGQVAERLRDALATYAWPSRRVTASFGVASLASGAADVPQLIDRADRALYHAMRQGRNRVSLEAADEYMQDVRLAA